MNNSVSFRFFLPASMALLVLVGGPEAYTQPLLLPSDKVHKVSRRLVCAEISGVWVPGRLQRKGSFLSFQDQVNILRKRVKRASKEKKPGFRRKLRRARRKLKKNRNGCAKVLPTVLPTVLNTSIPEQAPPIVRTIPVLKTTPTVEATVTTQPTTTSVPQPDADEPPTITPTPTLTATATFTPTATLSPAVTSTALATSTATLTPTATVSPTATASATPTATATAIFTSTATASPTATATAIPTATTPAPEPLIVTMQLVDPCTDTALVDFAPLTDATVDFREVPRNVTLEAVASEPVGSVQFFIDGNRVRSERFAPFAITGDIGGDLLGASLPLGEHVFSVKVFSGADGEGDLLAEESVELEFIDSFLLSGAVADFEIRSDVETTDYIQSVKLLEKGCYRAGVKGSTGPSFVDFDVQGVKESEHTFAPSTPIAAPFKFDFGVNGSVIVADTESFDESTEIVNSKIRYFDVVSRTTPVWTRLASDYFDMEDETFYAPRDVVEVNSEKSGIVLSGTQGPSFGRLVLLTSGGDLIQNRDSFSAFKLISDNNEGFFMLEYPNVDFDVVMLSHRFFDLTSVDLVTLPETPEDVEFYSAWLAPDQNGLYGIFEQSGSPQRFIASLDEETPIKVATQIAADPKSVAVLDDVVVSLYHSEEETTGPDELLISPGYFLAVFDKEGGLLNIQNMEFEFTPVRLLRGAGNSLLVQGESPSGYHLAILR